MTKLSVLRPLIILAILLLTLTFPEFVSAKDDSSPTAISPGKKEIVIVTEEGINPNRIKLDRTSSVFILNGTGSSQFHISVELGKSGLHCHSKNMQKDENGNLSSIEPVKPRDFALMCFPNKGEFEITVNGVEDFKKKFSSVVEIE